MKESDFILKTGTFAPVLEERSFTDDERVVLEYFFTNIDRNIYAAKDSMPSSLWALLEGGYSRSQLSMRMRFLNIFDEMQQEFDSGKLSAEDFVSVRDFADKIRSGSELDLSFFLSRAEKFMRKWAVQYGHDSLKDSDVVRFAIENISQCSVCPVEEARLGAYQEKSTRYVKFSKDLLIVPVDLQEFESDVREWNRLLMTNYEESQAIVSDFISKRLDASSFSNDVVFNRTVSAKTFDVIRYFLPSTLLTSLGVVWPTREAERHISRLLSDPREEVRCIGRALLQEGKKVSPGLLSHVNINEFMVSHRAIVEKINSGLSLPVPSPVQGRSDAVRLLQVSPDIDAHIAACLLFEFNYRSHSYSDFLELCLKDSSFVESVLSTYLSDRKYESLPMSCEVGNLLFELDLDFGAYRDLKRHRRNLFLVSPLTASFGFEYPEFVASESALSEVKSRLEFCAKKTAELHEKIKEKYPHLACYIVMFANKQRLIWQMDPRQLCYVVELRTTPAGHFSYRTICQEMFNLAKFHMPVFSRFIHADFSSGEEGRKRQEERTVEKLKELGGDVNRVSL